MKPREQDTLRAAIRERDEWKARAEAAEERARILEAAELEALKRAEAGERDRDEWHDSAVAEGKAKLRNRAELRDQENATQQLSSEVVRLESELATLRAQLDQTRSDWLAATRERLNARVSQLEAKLGQASTEALKVTEDNERLRAVAEAAEREREGWRASAGVERSHLSDAESELETLSADALAWKARAEAAELDAVASRHRAIGSDNAREGAELAEQRALAELATLRAENQRPAELARTEAEPVPMVLHCPECKARHVDEGEFATKVHHTHSCQGCGLTWRPAVVPTVGVRFLPGFKNADDERTEADKKAERRETGVHPDEPASIIEYDQHTLEAASAGLRPGWPTRTICRCGVKGCGGGHWAP